MGVCLVKECVYECVGQLYGQILLQTSRRLDAFHAPITAHSTHYVNSNSDSRLNGGGSSQPEAAIWCSKRELGAGWIRTKRQTR